MVEPEVAYFTLAEDMQLAEDFVAYIVARVLDRRREDLKVLERDTAKLELATGKPYPRITYDDAIERLKGKGFAVNWGDDLGADEETALSADFSTPVLVHRNPAASKPFNWYLDLRRYGSVPHAGFGMGIERAVTWICGIHHVREAAPFPRMMERLEP
jgi:asparaginyl-tRNA synthetase